MIVAALCVIVYVGAVQLLWAGRPWYYPVSAVRVVYIGLRATVAPYPRDNAIGTVLFQFQDSGLVGAGAWRVKTFH